jgi:hypothetical protein
MSDKEGYHGGWVWGLPCKIPMVSKSLPREGHGPKTGRSVIGEGDKIQNDGTVVQRAI